MNIFRIKLLKNVLLVSLVILFGLPMYNIFLISPSVNKMLTRISEQEAKQLAEHLATMFISEKSELDQNTFSSEVVHEIHRSQQHFQLEKIKIFSKSGEVVYSTNPKDIGKINTHKYFLETVAQGHAYTKVVRKGTPSLEGRTVNADVVETYVPIMNGDTFRGAFEIYYDITDRKEQFNQLLTKVFVFLFVSVCGLFLLILIMLLNAGRIITAQKQAEEALLKSEEAYRHLIENAEDIIYKTDATGRFTFFNPAAVKMTGYSEQELFNRKYLYLVHPDHQEDLKKFYGLQVKKKIHSTYREFSMRTKDGKELWIGQYVQLMTGDDQVLGFHAVARDITTRKRAEKAMQSARDELEMRVSERTAELSKANEELRKEIMERKKVEAALFKAKEAAEAANRAKGEFLATMSHELRTPLNAVIGFSEILADQDFGDMNERQIKYTNSILKSGRHLLDLVNDILSLAEAETGKAELDLSEFDISGSIHSVLDNVKPLAAKKNIAMRIELKESPLLITADEAKLKSILHNLLSNAVKFTPENGSITLAAKLGTGYSVLEGEKSTNTQYPIPNTQKDFIEISVSDSGIGIKPEDQERIFNRFEQIDSTYSREQEGTGLGLALARKLVELHGGRIWVESEGIGKGSRFSFILPESTTD